MEWRRKETYSYLGENEKEVKKRFLSKQDNTQSSIILNNIGKKKL